MFQVTVSVATLDQLYDFTGHLAALDFLASPVVEQHTAEVQPDPQTDISSPTTSPTDAGSDDQPATERQVNYMNDLASKASWELHLFEDAVVARYELDDFSQLTKAMASELITRLQNNNFQPELQG